MKVILSIVKDQKQLTYPLKFFLSYFGVGFIPFAPGTFGSLFTIPLLYLLAFTGFNHFALLLTILLLLLVSTIATEFIQKKEGLHDPGWIVIDEVLGMLTTWLIIGLSTETINIVLAFVYFRIFDIFKIYPATYFDKKVTHGFGTIFDDIISGVYAGLAVLATIWALNQF